MNATDAEITRISETYCEVCKYLFLTKVKKNHCVACNTSHQICDGCLSDNIKCSVKKKIM